jgi:hypothetical protein
MTLQDQLAVPVTLCRNCKNRLRYTDGSAKGMDVQEDFVCKEFPLRKVKDLVTNAHHWVGSVETTSLYPFRLCALVNNGRCKHYRPKKRFLATLYWILTGGQL